ncbi:type IV toxin-antitoxin system AbiEi family antitoxin domain-containing protein [Schleiferilactobacillus shenzhenensis]|uniref:AbiEi antitoxin N-terminal domain-containing protein n=1 Tax=Schleiferilactobacillus shenzhenensis LY-73 TaxID=1231336 RepID=U4TNH9_9LACO|nr:type IV toxin-antitoxin system AbiEi family antitoxin domain-containing protein [Schleiferilactobacillus shenzhenensis]ERL65774.1 hypothetical protein L248_1850 [Schleiferilactobacillus shenzhenensis LY-73]
MDDSAKVKQYLEQNHGSITRKQALAIGINTMTLSRMAAAGKLERADRGIYIDPDFLPDDFLLAQHRFSQGIFARDTALYLHGLTDRTPLLLDMNFPQSYHPAGLKESAIVPSFQAVHLYSLGITEVLTPGSHLVKTYDIERTLCDIIRKPNESENEVIVQAMNEYARRPNKDITRLFEYARALRVTEKMRGYMQVLL